MKHKDIHLVLPEDQEGVAMTNLLSICQKRGRNDIIKVILPFCREWQNKRHLGLKK